MSNRKIGPVSKCLINAQTYNTTTNTVDITDKLQGVQWVTEPLFTVVATEVNNGTTCDVDINSSVNGGANYEEVLSFTQLSASGREAKRATLPPWGDKVQAEITLGANGNNWTLSLFASGMAAGGGGE